MTRTASRTVALRTLALLVAAFLIAPAITECAGLVAAASRHACCDKRDGTARETKLTDCCALSTSDDATPPETQIARTSLKLPAQKFATVAALIVPARHVSRGVSQIRRPAFVPLYIQQASLLI